MFGTKKRYWKFLDELSETGFGMLGSEPHLLSKFPELNRQTARKLLSQWLKAHVRRYKHLRIQGLSPD